MNIVKPQPFMFKGGNRAVLLLHGFTGNTADVKKMGRYLQKEGYTCYAPLYKGHGLDPKEILQTNPEYWLQDAISGYELLQNQGFEEIAVVGISLGGVFSLRVGSVLPVKGVVSMCAPIKLRSTEGLFSRVAGYAKIYKQFEGKNEEQINFEIEELREMPMDSLESLQNLIHDTIDVLKDVTSPTLVLQGGLDHPIYQESANIIYEKVNTRNKQMTFYGNSSHIITLGEEKDKIFRDVHLFLDSLNWNK